MTHFESMTPFNLNPVQLPMIPTHILYIREAAEAHKTCLPAVPPFFFFFLAEYFIEVGAAKERLETACQGEPPTRDILKAFYDETTAAWNAIPLYERDYLLAFNPVDDKTTYIIASLRTDN